jgi:alpha-beta hydrolase superfamily lysophospholipase
MRMHLPHFRDFRPIGRDGRVTRGWYWVAILVLAAAMMAPLGSSGIAQSRAHVYLFRGLADVFSTGMDTLAQELNIRGVYATSHSHSDWKSIADRAAADYKAGKEGPIILIGHSLGADAVMEMADYLGDKGVPVALVVPFDGTQSFPAPGNVSRVLNFTQRDYAFMRPGPGFRGSLTNVDLRSDSTIDHLTIDKSPRLHARVISEVLAIVGGHTVAPGTAKPAATTAAAPTGADGGFRPTFPGEGAAKPTAAMKPAAESHSTAASPPATADPTTGSVPAPIPPHQPHAPPRAIDPAQIPD